MSLTYIDLMKINVKKCNGKSLLLGSHIAKIYCTRVENMFYLLIFVLQFGFSLTETFLVH